MTIPTDYVSELSELLVLATTKADECAAALRRWSPLRKFAADEMFEIADMLNGAACTPAR